jgi:hypothetical protein
VVKPVRPVSLAWSEAPRAEPYAATVAYPGYEFDTSKSRLAAASLENPRSMATQERMFETANQRLLLAIATKKGAPRVGLEPTTNRLTVPPQSSVQSG